MRFMNKEVTVFVGPTVAARASADALAAERQPLGAGGFRKEKGDELFGARKLLEIFLMALPLSTCAAVWQRSSW